MTRTAPARSGWITAAALVMAAEGCLALVYLPILGGGWPGPLPVIIAALSLAGLITAVGLLRLDGWARYAAAALAGLLLLLRGLSILATLALLAGGTGVTLDPAEPIELAAAFLVLFAVARRWPHRDHTGPTGAPVGG